MNKKIGVMTCFCIVMLFVGMAWATEDEIPSPPQETTAVEEETSSSSAEVQEGKVENGFGHKLIFYLPNRVLDVFDFVRLRLRVGPGLAVGARATKLVSFFLGGYTSVFVGLPGPRLEPMVKLPVGLENYAGIGVSLADATTGGGFGPNYSSTEIEAGFQLLILGIDIGVDPYEILDLAAGFLFIDLRGDDF